MVTNTALMLPDDENERQKRSIYNQLALQNASAAVHSLGMTIAKSGMFGSLTEVQGDLLSLECFSQHLPPMQLALRYHVIDNKLSMKADAMLAEFNERGGRHKIISRTPERAEVEMTWDGNTHAFAFTWDDAKQEPFVYNGKQTDILKALASGGKLEVKAKYATPRSRAQMLWARVTSDGVRAMCPGVNFGRYTPEELGEDEEPESQPQPAKKGGGKVKTTSSIDSLVAEGKPEPAKPSVATTAAPSNTVDAEFEKAIVTTTPLLTLEAKIAATSDPAAYRANICKHFGVGALIGLTGEQIAECLQRFAEQEAGATTTAAAEVDDSDTTEEDTSALSAPCTSIQIEEFKKLIAALVTTYTDLGGRIQAELAKLVAKEEIKEPRASQLTMHAMAILLEDLKRGDANLTQFKAKVSEVPF